MPACIENILGTYLHHLHPQDSNIMRHSQGIFLSPAFSWHDDIQIFPGHIFISDILRTSRPEDILWPYLHHRHGYDSNHAGIERPGLLARHTKHRGHYKGLLHHWYYTDQPASTAV